MFKVICINSSNFIINRFICECDLKEGEVYTVIKEVIEPNTKMKGFVLQEVKSSNPTGSYSVSRFALTSDIDETELAEQREQLQTV